MTNYVRLSLFQIIIDLIGLGKVPFELSLFLH